METTCGRRKKYFNGVDFQSHRITIKMILIFILMIFSVIPPNFFEIFLENYNKSTKLSQIWLKDETSSFSIVT